MKRRSRCWRALRRDLLAHPADPPRAAPRRCLRRGATPRAGTRTGGVRRRRARARGAAPSRCRTTCADGQIAVHWEHGYGDVLFFARFLPALRARGARMSRSPCPAATRIDDRASGRRRCGDRRRPGARGEANCWPAICRICCSPTQTPRRSRSRRLPSTWRTGVRGWPRTDPDHTSASHGAPGRPRPGTRFAPQPAVAGQAGRCTALGRGAARVARQLVCDPASPVDDGRCANSERPPVARCRARRGHERGSRIGARLAPACSISTPG